ATAISSLAPSIPENGGWIGLGFFLVAVLLSAFFYFKKFPKKFFIASLVLLSLGLGFIRFHIDVLNDGDKILDTRIGETITVDGIITTDPDRRQRYTGLTIRVDQMITGDIKQYIDTKILVRAERYPEFKYGDSVRVTGKLEQPENFTGDTGRTFDYKNYLGKEGVFYMVSFGQVEKISSGHGNPVKRWVLSLKRRLVDSINQTHQQPQGALLSGILLGEKSALGGPLEENFRTTGIIHIIVLSGYNVTLVADAIVRMFSFIGVSAGMWFGSIGIILFAILTGGGATVVRASVMALLVIVGRYSGRQYDVIRGLWFAVFIMVLINPKILLFDISFQLSFLATYGLIEVAPRLEKYFLWVPTRFQIRENLLATVSTQIFVLPLLLFAIGDLSIISPIVNVLVLVVIPFAMLIGFITAVLGIASPVIAVPTSLISHLDLSYVLKIVEWFASIPFAKVTVPAFPVWVMFAGYAGIFWWLYKTKET
ncbi:MAG: ComEC family competence protein, partial [Candidatus Nomurabacteria bacterium]|nr:ComEC family competence protein [Candidatus Nomurabacteria bacterium]